MGLQNGLWDTNAGVPGGHKTEYKSEFGRDRYGDQVKVPPSPAPRVLAASGAMAGEDTDTSDMWPTVNADYGVYADVPRLRKGPKKTYGQSSWLANNGAPLPPPGPFDVSNYMIASDQKIKTRGINSSRYPRARDIMQNQFPRFYQSLPRDTSAYTRQPPADILKVSEAPVEDKNGAQKVLPTTAGSPPLATSPQQHSTSPQAKQ